MLWRRMVAVVVMVALIVPIATGGRAQQGENATPAPTAVGSPAVAPTRVPVTSLPSTGTGGQAGPGAWAMGVVLTGLAAAGVSLILLRRRRV